MTSLSPEMGGTYTLGADGMAANKSSFPIYNSNYYTGYPVKMRLRSESFLCISELYSCLNLLFMLY